MIHASWPWKQELTSLSEAMVAEAVRVKLDSEDDEFFPLERAIFYSAFVMRKLIENRKVTDKIANHSFEVEAFRSIKPKAGNLGYSGSAGCDFAKEFDLDSPHVIRIAPYDLCGEIIHSHKLGWEFGEVEEVSAILVCSYKNEEERLLRIPIALLCDLSHIVEKDTVTEVRAVRGSKRTKGGERPTVKYEIK